MRHPSELRKVAFSPDDRLILTVCSDGSVYVWDVGSCKLVCARPRNTRSEQTSRNTTIVDGMFSSDGSSFYLNAGMALYDSTDVPPQLTDNRKIVPAWSQARTGLTLQDDSIRLQQLTQSEWLAAQAELDSLEKLPSP